MDFEVIDNDDYSASISSNSKVFQCDNVIFGIDERSVDLRGFSNENMDQLGSNPVMDNLDSSNVFNFDLMGQN